MQQLITKVLPQVEERHPKFLPPVSALRCMSGPTHQVKQFYADVHERTTEEEQCSEVSIRLYLN